MATIPLGSRKKRKFTRQVCYFCGMEPCENEDIPGRLFGVNAQTGGLLLPVCRNCNTTWHEDQEFVRLRITLNAGSSPGGTYIKKRELARVKGSEKRKPQVGRYLAERVKQFFLDGKELLGLTDEDLAKFGNVLVHWAAGVHYDRRGTRPALPGSVVYQFLRPSFFQALTLSPKVDGEWRTVEGEHFGCWWFLPGTHSTESITIFNLLASNQLWFAVRFPAWEVICSES